MEIKKIWVFLFLALATNQGIGSANGLTCKFVKDIESYHRSMWLAGTKTSQMDLVACIDHAWRYYDTEATTKSVEFTFFASNYLLSALQFNSRDFIVEAEKRPALIAKWLKNIDYEIFTWREDSPCGRQSQIDQVTFLLRTQRNLLSHFESYQLISNRFKNLRCNKID